MLSALKGLLAGLGVTPTQKYNAWYQYAYLPYYYAQLAQQQAALSQQQCPYGYTRAIGGGCQSANPAYPYTYPVSAYGTPPYSNPAIYQPYSQYGSYPYNSGSYAYPYGNAGANSVYTYGNGPLTYASQGVPMSAQACVSQGGMYDAFTDLCSSFSGSQPYGNTTSGVPGPLPNTVGLQMYSAIAQLNGSGYEVWLMSSDGSPVDVPPSYNPRRVLIWTRGGVVVQQQVG